MELEKILKDLFEWERSVFDFLNIWIAIFTSDLADGGIIVLESKKSLFFIVNKKLLKSWLLGFLWGFSMFEVKSDTAKAWNNDYYHYP